MQLEGDYDLETDATHPIIPDPLLSKIDALSRNVLGRPLAHLSARYMWDRCRLWHFQRRRPGTPWLTAQAIELLEQLLTPNDNGLEYGSGRSTIWLAKRTRSLISVESSPTWHAQVGHLLANQNIDNVHHRYIDILQDSNSPSLRNAYVEGEPSFKNESFDYVLVDGIFRSDCALRAIEVLKPGGILVLDNAEWFLPRATRAPYAVANYAGAKWARLATLTATWRCINTTNGVWDTTLWIKPPSPAPISTSKSRA